MNLVLTNLNNDHRNIVMALLDTFIAGLATSLDRRWGERWARCAR